MSVLSWLLPTPKFYVVQHHGGGTARHGPYPWEKAKAEYESFRRDGFSSWIENKNGPRFRSPHQPDFRPVSCFKEAAPWPQAVSEATQPGGSDNAY